MVISRSKQFVSGACLFTLVVLFPVPAVTQGLVEYALVLCVVGVGSEENVEFYVAPPRTEKTEPSIGRDPFGFTITVTNAGPSGNASRESCTQTVRFSRPLGTTPAIVRSNRVVAADGSTSLLVDDEVFPLDSCFDGTSRLLLTLGRPVPPGGPAKGVVPRVLGYSVVRNDGATAATISYGDFWTPGPPVYVDVTE